MKRTPEPELMTDADQVQAYAHADFAVPHQRFVTLLGERFPELPNTGTALDLGCGPGDVTCRFARTYTGWKVHGLDASRPMIECGQQLVKDAGLAERVTLLESHLPAGNAPLTHYDFVLSNSLLHHLSDPLALWHSVQRWSRSEGPVFVMDLLRPSSPEEVRRLVEQYSEGEPLVLRRDFEYSLHAAYRVDEVREQLAHVGLADLTVEVVSDRHFVVWGRCP
jgi:ubiquinone/menaquinone biosynthesis C-methylase UbiE